MNIGLYILRSVKYFIKLIVLLAIVFALMTWSGTSSFKADSLSGFFESFFAGRQGWLFMAAVVVWCIAYPAVEFVTRHMNYDMHRHKHAIIKAMDMGGMKLADDSDGRMVFRSESVVRKLWWLGDDAVTVTRNLSGGFNLEGPRKFVGEAMQRIPGYIDAGEE